MRRDVSWVLLPGAGQRLVLAWIAIVAMAIVLRLASASGDFWLDEVVSLNLARHFSAVEIVASPEARHDNNHVLNTLYLRAVEGGAREGVYRALSIASGVATVVLMGWIAGRRSRRAALLAAFLGSFSYILVHYGSEARGYSLAAALGLAAWLVVERELAQPGFRNRLGLAILVALGYLAHYSFAFVYAGLVSWMWVHALRSDGPWTTRIGFFARQNAVPLGVSAAIYFLHVAPMHLAGGPEFGVGWALWSGLGESLGFQFHAGTTAAARWAPAVALAMVATECWLCLREGREDVAFLLGLLGVSSLGTVLVIRPEFVVPRYFFVAIPFVLIAVASLLDRGFSGGRAPRLAAWGAIAFMLLGSIPRDLALIDGGRGHYREAVEFMADHGGPVVSVSGTDPRWVRVLIDGYYAQFRPDVRFEVRESPGRSGGSPAQWYLDSNWARNYRAPEFVEPGDGRARYRFVEHYPFASLSGWHWYLYRLEP